MVPTFVHTKKKNNLENLKKMLNKKAIRARSFVILFTFGSTGRALFENFLINSHFFGFV